MNFSSSLSLHISKLRLLNRNSLCFQCWSISFERHWINLVNTFYIPVYNNRWLLFQEEKALTKLMKYYFLLLSVLLITVVLRNSCCQCNHNCPHLENVCPPDQSMILLSWSFCKTSNSQLCQGWWRLSTSMQWKSPLKAQRVLPFQQYDTPLQFWSETRLQ